VEHRRPCPACASRYVAFVQDVLGRRTGRRYPQFACLDCRSFFHRSDYRETDEQKGFDFQFLFNEREAHDKLQNQLFLELKTRLPHLRTVCEVGHGLGLLLKAVRDYGCDGYGFEVNRLCHDFAREQLGLSCELGLFGPDHPRTYDLITSVMVFEHLEAPRDLFAAMRDRLNPDGAIYLSVPFAHRHEWPYLWTADSAPGTAPPDIFYDNDVHITHFSVEGMRQMGLSLGARHADYFVSQDTAHRSPGAYHGVLFRF
jgi:SAM-dependent methyltransferase